MKKTTEQFIKDAKQIHGERYDYSKVEYLHARTKVKIVCYKHGVFEQTPNSHLQGINCPSCGKHIKTTEQFLEDAKQIHGDLYDYSQVEYTGNKNKVTIICYIHGEFQQVPNNHSKGQGCPSCFGNAKKTTEQFLEDAKQIHGDRYDYSQVKYTGSKNKVKIICSKHGEFEQSPDIHLRGSGCSSCVGKIVKKLLE